ncbi:MAG: hypothetical protein ACTSU5_09895 [Promethearchaeota archaeon]
MLQLLEKLVEDGNSVVVIEHSPHVLRFCDWIVELGPGGGPDGGEVVATGTPGALKENPASLVAPFL